MQIMGGGASSSPSPSPSNTKRRASSQKKIQHNLPDDVYEILGRCLSSLPFSPGTIDDDTIRKAAQNAERRELNEPQVILRKGDPSRGIFIIIQGDVEVVSSSDVVIATLSAGDLFGEVSSLFSLPCTATVRTPNKVLLLALPNEFLKTALKGKVVSGSLLEYYAQKRYLDTSGAVNQSELVKRVTRSVLQEVPMFKQWGEVALDALIESLHSEGPMITLAPVDSFLAMEGDPADEIIIVMKGRVEVRKEKELLSTLDSKRWPAWNGEEGLFTGRRSSVSIKTITPCQFIIIKNSLIVEVVKKYKQDASADFMKRLEIWRQKVTTSNNNQTFYPIQVIIQRLLDTELLSNIPLDGLYKLAVNSKIYMCLTGEIIIGEAKDEGNPSKMLKSGGSKPANPPAKIEQTVAPGADISADKVSQVFWAEDAFLLMLKGAMMLNGTEEWVCRDGEMLWFPQRVIPSSTLVAKRDSLILRFSGSALEGACSDYPEITLTVPSTVRST